MWTARFNKQNKNNQPVAYARRAEGEWGSREVGSFRWNLQLAVQFREKKFSTAAD